MNNLICACSGSIYSWVDSDINMILDIWKQVDIDGIELCHANKSDLFQKISDENIRYLRGLKVVSIHSPFFDCKYKTEEETKRVLDAIERECALVNAKHVVFHGDVQSFDLINQYAFTACLENASHLFKKPTAWYRKKLQQHPEMKFILDACHAVGCDQLDDLIDTLGKETAHIHFSDFSGGKYHKQFLYAKDKERFERVKELDVPIVVEVNIIDRVGDIQNLKSEIQAVRDYFT